MSKSISINTHEIVNTFNITSFQVSVQYFELFKGATLLVSLVDDTNTLRKQESIRLEGDDYKQWMNDDNYVYNFVASKCGFTIKPEPTPESVVSTPTEPTPTEPTPTEPTPTEPTPTESTTTESTTTEPTPTEPTPTEPTPTEQPQS